MDDDNTVRRLLASHVRVGFDQRVHKWYLGPHAKRRMANEVAVLTHLANQGCPFVPRIIQHDLERLYMTTTYCGARAQRPESEMVASIYAQLLPFGVQHNDPTPDYLIYDPMLFRYCIVDFQLSSLIEVGDGLCWQDLLEGPTIPA